MRVCGDGLLRCLAGLVREPLPGSEGSCLHTDPCFDVFSFTSISSLPNILYQNGKHDIPRKQVMGSITAEIINKPRFIAAGVDVWVWARVSQTSLALTQWRVKWIADSGVPG